MKTSLLTKFAGACLAIGCLASAPAAQACAMCYGGRSDSPLAIGMNWGIAVLMVFIVGVLSCFAAFGIYLVRKAGAVAKAEAEAAAMSHAGAQKAL
jgi:hypothetical protein